MPNVRVSGRWEERILSGHPWVYRSDVGRVEAAAGDIVEVATSRGRPLAHALYSDRSEIALRVLTRGVEPASFETVRARLARAIEFRNSLNIDATAYRLVHGEADLLPSLVVDRYGDYLVLQTLSQGTDKVLPRIVEHLAALLEPAGILARNDPKVRALEGLPQTIEVLHGDIPDAVEVREG